MSDANPTSANFMQYRSYYSPPLLSMILVMKLELRFPYIYIYIYIYINYSSNDEL